MTITHDNDERPVKIGIAVTTTPNRSQIFEQWYSFYKLNAKNIHLYIHKDWDYNGVAYSKNRCLKALYEYGFEHIFLFDDDLFIKSSEFVNRYVNSGLNHACWNYDKQIINRVAYVPDTKFKITKSIYPDEKPEFDYCEEYASPNGCMLYVRRNVLDVVGGFDIDFKGYGFDHVNWSDRIYNLGLTPARYIDIPNSKHLFELADCESTFSNEVRMATIPINLKLYQQKYYSKEFKPFI